MGYLDTPMEELKYTFYILMNGMSLDSCNFALKWLDNIVQDVNKETTGIGENDDSSRLMKIVRKYSENVNSAMTLLHKGGFIEDIETIVRDWSKTFPGKFIFKLAHSLCFNFVSLFYFFKQTLS